MPKSLTAQANEQKAQAITNAKHAAEALHQKGEELRIALDSFEFEFSQACQLGCQFSEIDSNRVFDRITDARRARNAMELFELSRRARLILDKAWEALG